MKCLNQWRNYHTATRAVKEEGVYLNFPKISLPQFDASNEIWLAFRDTYVTMIHKSSLSKVEKFHYLKSALIDKAAKTIENLQVTELFYEIA